MSAIDFRQLIEVGPHLDGEAQPFVAVAVEDPTAVAPIRLEVSIGGFGVALFLDYATAGELFDTLAGAMREVIGGQATAKLHPNDTPDAP